jgi:hypothetical protein
MQGWYAYPVARDLRRQGKYNAFDRKTGSTAHWGKLPDPDHLLIADGMSASRA